MALIAGRPTHDFSALLADDLFADLLAALPRTDSDLWDEWEWSELSAETRAALAYFEPAEIIYLWEEDLLMAKKAKLGSGKRFKALKSKLAKQPGVKNPGAVAAAIGAKKYGRAKMTKMAAAGRKRKSK